MKAQANKIVMALLLATAPQGVARAGKPESKLNQLSAAEKKAGWSLLFDGKTTSGWRGYKKETTPDTWKIEDGVLTHTGRDSSDRDDIITADEYDNFELALEWKISPGGNSGIMYRVVEGPALSYLSGPEMQVLDNALHPDGKDPKRSAGSCYDLYAPAKVVAHPAGEWNKARLVVKGNDVEHWLNGEKVVAYQLGSEDWTSRVAHSKWKGAAQYGRASKGHLVLQDHPNQVWYRNVKIRRLPAR